MKFNLKIKREHIKLVATVVVFFVIGGTTSFFLTKKVLPRKLCEVTCKKVQCEPVTKCAPVKCPTCKKCIDPDVFCKERAAKYVDELNEKLYDIYLEFTTQEKRGKRATMIKDKFRTRLNNEFKPVYGLEPLYLNATYGEKSGIVEMF